MSPLKIDEPGAKDESFTPTEENLCKLFVPAPPAMMLPSLKNLMA